MTHLVYDSLVRLHPAEFRREFGDQMLCIFDEMSAANATRIRLLGDAVVSLARQWFLRSGLWKAGASVLLSTLLFQVFPLWPGRIRPWMMQKPFANPSGPEPPFDLLVKMTLLAVGIVAVVLVATVSWSRAVSRRRNASCHWNYARSRNATAGYRLSRT